MLRGGTFIDRADAHAEISDYIESYYNTQGKHSSLDYTTPNQFEAIKLTLNLYANWPKNPLHLTFEWSTADLDLILEKALGIGELA
jgi:hypothetical protein